MNETLSNVDPHVREQQAALDELIEKYRRPTDQISLIDWSVTGRGPDVLSPRSRKRYNW